MLFQLGKDGAVLKFELDQDATELEEYFLLWTLAYYLLQLLLYLLAELVALGELAGVVVAARQIAVNYYLPVAVNVLQDILPQLHISLLLRQAYPRTW